MPEKRRTNKIKKSVKTKTTAQITKSATKDNPIRVRMYRVGFGDCFLLSLPVGQNGTEDYRHFVIDCGVHGKGNIGTIGRAVDNIAEVTGGKIAAVIATHSHQDHISGFSDKFCQFEIGEVWMPWCENPKDELAAKWNKKQADLVDKLERHFMAQAKAGAAESSTSEREKALAALVNLSSNESSMNLLVKHFKGEDAEALTAFAKLTSNAKALQLLKGGFNVNAKVSYLEGGMKMNDAASIPGLEIQFLSPPRDQKFLSKMDPPDDQRYLRLDDANNINDVNKLVPFTAKWTVDFNTSPVKPLTAADEKELSEELLDTSLNGLAFALDSAKNNTSLVTLFIYRGQYLLFPGDAQYGNWKYWLDTEGSDILPNIDFLKVAHHGSINATPKEVVDKLTAGKAAAMVSTQSVPWDSIPREPLMTQLDIQTKQRMVRSDWIKVSNAPEPSAHATPPEPVENPKGFNKGEFWYDYEI